MHLQPSPLRTKRKTSKKRGLGTRRVSACLSPLFAPQNSLYMVTKNWGLSLVSP